MTLSRYRMKGATNRPARLAHAVVTALRHMSLPPSSWAPSSSAWRWLGRDEAILDKITMSAFEGTPLSIALRDCGLIAFAIAGVAVEIGIEPTVRHGGS